MVDLITNQYLSRTYFYGKLATDFDLMIKWTHSVQTNHLIGLFQIGVLIIQVWTVMIEVAKKLRKS